MASPWRNLQRAATCTGIAVILASTSITARAEIDLNRLVFPKASSTGTATSTATSQTDDPAPQMPGVPGDPNQQTSNQSNQSDSHRHSGQPNAPANNRAAGPEYQSQRTSGAYPGRSDAAVNLNQRSPKAGSGNRPASYAPSTSQGDAQAAYSNGPWAASPQYGNIGAGAGRYPNGGYGTSGYGNPAGMNNSQKPGWSVASIFGMERPQPSGVRMASMAPGVAPQSVMQTGPNNIPPGSVISDRAVPSTNQPPRSTGSMNRPAVTPDAVYLEGESIPPGAVHSGNMMPSGQMMMNGGMMEGGPMGHSPDGFTSPYCNDCNCGGPGCGGGCGSAGCGGGGGFFRGLWGGGCGGECSNCEGECGDCHQCPYGRPWILAPIDAVVYVLSPPNDGSWYWGENFSVFGGVHNFKSPVNMVGQSNFGTQEGINWGVPLWEEIGLGGQIGVGITQSNFQDTGFPFDDYRTQTFVTGALYHRPACRQGLQYGLAFDWLHDEFYDNFDVAQVRGEISWLYDCRDEIGFWFATGVIDDQVNHQFLSPATFEVLDQYAFFYRRQFCRGGDARIWGGFTGENAGLVGVDFSLPIARCWSIEGGFNYVISDRQTQGLTDETWNLGMNLVWSWGGNAFCRNAYRPLFNVADNGSLMTRVIDRGQ